VQEDFIMQNSPRVIDRIALHGIVPVISLRDPDCAVPVAAALRKGGLPVAEVTFRTNSAAESIRRIHAADPVVCLGAGTVLTTQQVDQALEAGAEFIVTPGFNRRVVEHCLGRGIPVLPGCSCPTDFESALEYGITDVKFFPAEQSGGLPALKAMAGPYSMLRFVPTGSIDAGNLKDYLSFDKVIACGGSWMVKEDRIAAGDFDGISRLTSAAVDIVLGFELSHVGVNPYDQAAVDLARNFNDLFGRELTESGSSFYIGGAVEVLKERGRGANGHLAIRTRSISRAVDWLERRGVKVDMESKKQDASGHRVTVYLVEEVGGFAIHLLQEN
jgi:2-dehydro-3-deoxyphosphogluconate aldolase/(4S)-4-hydroxy-2-oxoglutarate aldolase